MESNLKFCGQHASFGSLFVKSNGLSKDFLRDIKSSKNFLTARLKKDTIVGCIVDNEDDNAVFESYIADQQLVFNLQQMIDEIENRLYPVSFFDERKQKVRAMLSEFH
jgi:hypothetical protein